MQLGPMTRINTYIIKIIYLKFAKTINNNPEKYFTDDVMERLEVVVRDYFKYGNENRTDDTQESDSE